MSNTQRIETHDEQEFDERAFYQKITDRVRALRATQQLSLERANGIARQLAYATTLREYKSIAREISITL